MRFSDITSIIDTVATGLILTINELARRTKDLARVGRCLARSGVSHQSAGSSTGAQQASQTHDDANSSGPGLNARRLPTVPARPNLQWGRPRVSANGGDSRMSKSGATIYWHGCRVRFNYPIDPRSRVVERAVGIDGISQQRCNNGCHPRY